MLVSHASEMVFSVMDIREKQRNETASSANAPTMNNWRNEIPTIGSLTSSALATPRALISFAKPVNAKKPAELYKNSPGTRCNKLSRLSSRSVGEVVIVSVFKRSCVSVNNSCT